MNGLMMIEGLDLAVVVLIFLLGLFMPWLARRELPFGIRMPEDFAAGEEVKKLKAGYFRTYLLVCGFYSAGLVVWRLKSGGPEVVNYGAFGQVAIMFVMYLVYRTRAFRLKQELRPMEGKRQVTVADTSSEPKVPFLSWWWFLLPLAVIAVNVSVGLSRYDSLPARIPLHFDAMGHADSWGPKSVLLVLFLPIVQLFITSITMFAFSAFRTGKRQLSPQRPEESAAQSTIFNRRWSEWVMVTTLALVSATSMIYWHTIGLIKLAPAELITGILVPVAAIVIYAVVLTVKYGQGGTRARVAVQGDGGDPSVVRRDDDAFWKAGLIYYNPDDPSLWVEKRFGVGYTLNFGNRKSFLLMAVPLMAVVGLVGMSLALVSSMNVKVDEPEFLKQVEPVVQNLFDALKSRQYDRMERDFSPEMKSASAESKFKSFNEGRLLPRLGEYRSSAFDRFEYKGGFVAVVYKAGFEKEDGVTVRFVFAPGDPEVKIMGLWFDSPKLRK